MPKIVKAATRGNYLYAEETVNLLRGGQVLYVADTPIGGVAGTTYYASKWAYIAAGTYTISVVTADIAEIRLNGRPIILATGAPAQPAGEVKTAKFTVAAGTYRMDVSNRKLGNNGYCFFAFMITNAAGEVAMLSDPWAWAGELAPTQPNEWVGGPPPAIPSEPSSIIPESDLGTKPQSSDDARLRLPVFLLRPNWRRGVLETLAWLTDVMTSETGAEQRRAVRRTPRRTFEATFDRQTMLRSYLDNFIAGIGQNDCVIPMWPYRTRLKEQAPSGATQISGDFTGYELDKNYLAVIQGDDLLDFELVKIANITDTSLTLSTPIQFDWPEGTSITPARVAYLDNDVVSTALIPTVGSVTLRFNIKEENRWETPRWHGMVHPADGQPVIQLRHNWARSIVQTFSRRSVMLDNDAGLPHIGDASNQSSSSLRVSTVHKGAQSVAQFKDILYKARGRMRRFYVSTGEADVILAQGVSAGPDVLVAERSGYAQFNTHAQAIRRNILVELNDGSFVINRITGVQTVGDKELLILDETMGTIQQSNVRQISFLAPARFEIDQFELQHHADITGVTEIPVVFRLFDNRRDAKPIIPVEF